MIRERGRLDWAGLTALLKGAAVYVGPDTSMTHLAAGSGCPTIALYGPTSPRLIGPWPVGGLAEPWDHAGTIQRRGNVWVVQNPLPCLPCEKLGCDGHLDSRSQCLDELLGASGACGGRSGAATVGAATGRHRSRWRASSPARRNDVERRIRLLVALIEHDAGPPVDDLIPLHEDGVVVGSCRVHRASGM